MLVIELILSMFGIGLFCWLIFTLAVYALPFFVGLTAGMAAFHDGAQADRFASCRRYIRRRSSPRRRVVVDDQAFQREAEQAREHAGRLVDQVRAGIADQRMVEAFS